MPAKASHVRERLLETADQLFYTEGVRAVGIDRIIADAGVAKMSFYNHFPSKDDLILAVLRRREENVLAMFDRSMQKQVRAGVTPLEAFFVALEQWFQMPDFRGCAFINARVELADSRHPASMFAAAHKVRFHDLVRRIVTDSTADASAERTARAIALLVEGAIITAVMEESPHAASNARDAALSLLKPRKS
jgi:AcrR family transcriptional regulator